MKNNIFKFLLYVVIIIVPTMVGLPQQPTGVKKSVHAMATNYPVTGGGNYCAGGIGVAVGLNGSQTNVDYYLKCNGNFVSGAVANGTGFPITFGNQTQSGTYTVTSYDLGTLCWLPMTGIATVVVNPIPHIVFALNGPATFCQGGNVTITSSISGVNPPYNYQWLLNNSNINGATAASYTAGTLGTGMYKVMVTDGTCANTKDTLVTINPLPQVFTVSTLNTHFCQNGTGGTIQLSNSQNGISYQVKNGLSNVGSPLMGSNGSTLSFGGITTSNVPLTIVAKNIITDCPQQMSGSVTFIQDPLPLTASIIGPASFCEGQQATYNVTIANATSYTWTVPNGMYISGQGTNSIQVIGNTPQTGTISVVGVNGCGNGQLSNLSITVNPKPVATIVSNPANATICNGQSIYLTANGGTSATWYPGAISGLVYNPSPTANTTYTTIISNSFGCLDTAQIAVTVNSNPIVNISTNPIGGNICQGTNATMTAGGATTYVWNDNYTLPIHTVSPGTTTTYTVTGTTNGCTASANTVITVHSLPIASITSNPTNATICVGGNVTLTAGGGSSYIWNNGLGTTNTVTVTPTTTTVYTVTVTNANGCTASNSILVTVNSLPIASLIPVNPSICLGSGGVMLFASIGNGYSYAWSNGGNNLATNMVNPTSTTNYTVTITDGNSCSATATTLVTVNSLPIATINPPTTSVCPGFPASLSAGGGTTYAWSNGLGTANTVTVNPTTNTTYTVTVTNSNSCMSTASAVVTVNPGITASISGNNSICIGQNTTLTSSVGTFYSWSNGLGTNNSVTVNPITNTTYTVTVTNAYGCTATANYAVTVHSLPIVNVGSNSPICIGNTINLTSSSNLPATFSWIGPNGFTSNSQNPFLGSAATAMSGQYIVTATTLVGTCTTINSTMVTVHTPPTLSINTTTPTVCAGTNVMLLAVASSGTISWTGPNNFTYPSSNPTLVNTIPAMSGYYTATVVDSGCTVSATTGLITINPIPIVIISGTTTICNGQSTTLGTTVPGAYYGWSTGLTTASITVTPNTNTTYTVMVTGINGCTASNSATVTVNAIPTLNVTANPATICAGDNSTLAATGNATIFAWSNSDNNQSTLESPPSTTTYYVTVTGAFGCTNSGNVTVHVNLLPNVNVNLTEDNFCTDIYSAVLSGGVPLGGTYTGNCVFSNNTVYPPVSGPGTYTIDYVYTDGNGCSNSATDLLTINPIPAVMFTNIPGPIYTDTPPFNLMGNVSPASGIFTGPGIMSGSSIFNPAIAGVGNHMITYTYTHPSSGCSASQIQYIIVGPGNVGVNEVFNISGIMIFPSPVTNQLNLSGINTKEIISLRIINILGQTLYTNTTLNETMTIDVSSFAQGTYIISFVNADGISIGKKFIKSK